MNKHEYLATLEKALKAAGVRDYSDILEEYEEHFDLKTADGYSEEEVAARLGPPDEIAAEFKEITPRASHKVITKIFIAIGLFFANVAVGIPLFITLYAWILSLAALAVSVGLAGVVMVTGIDRLEILSAYVQTVYTPYISALLSGISLMALAVLSAVGLLYCILYVSRLLKAYLRLHRTIWTGARNSLPKPLHPVISPKKRRRMRSVALISVLIFAVFLVAGYVSMVIISGMFEPWHLWGWFI